MIWSSLSILTLLSMSQATVLVSLGNLGFNFANCIFDLNISCHKEGLKQGLIICGSIISFVSSKQRINISKRTDNTPPVWISGFCRIYSQANIRLFSSYAISFNANLPRDQRPTHSQLSLR